MAKWLEIDKCSVVTGSVLVDNSDWPAPLLFACTGPDPLENQRQMIALGAQGWQLAPARIAAPKGKKKVKGYTEEFETKVWAPFPHRPNESKLEGFRAWQRLTVAEQREVIEKLPFYVIDCRGKDPQYLPALSVWLNQKRFETLRTPLNLPSNVPSAPMTESAWRSSVLIFQKTNNWNNTLGPQPGSPGCLVPPTVLRDCGL